MDAQSWQTLKADYDSEPELITFWEELRPGYLYFEQHKQLPAVTFAADGRYVIGKE